MLLLVEFSGIEKQRVLTLKTWIFRRFHTREVKTKRETRQKRYFVFKREWVTIAVPDDRV